ncbi:hypothetical protein [Halomicrobium mukohataei]|nr:hypothetical protein [Halomicrobium mukohataei]
MQKLNEMREMKKQLDNPHDSEKIRAAARVLAEMENRPRESYIDVMETAGMEPETDPLDIESRVDELCDVIAAKVPGGPSMIEVWLSNCLPDDIETDDPQTLLTYAEMDRGEWEGQVARWADTVRHQQDGLDGYDDRLLADKHVQGHWGVSLARFEQAVVELDDQRAMEDLLGEPTDETVDAIESLTEVVA